MQDQKLKNSIYIIRKLIKKRVANIRLADKFLILFMLIFMIQATVNLFTHEIAAQDTSVIDVVVRTTAAAIFGYFISTNFLRKRKDNSEATEPPPADTRCQWSADELRRRENQQIFVVGMIGLSSLLILVAARAVGDFTPQATATLALLRDFISGSVGLLIGSTGESKQ